MSDYTHPAWWKGTYARGLPAWRVHQGENGLYYARFLSGPGMVIVHAPSPVALSRACMILSVLAGLWMAATCGPVSIRSAPLPAVPGSR